MTIEEFLGLLRGVRQTGSDRYVACCPAHEDRSPSLAITSGPDERILIHCFAGCRTEEVVGSLGLEMVDLFPTRVSRHGQQFRRPFDAIQVLHCVAREIAVVAVIVEDVLNGTVVMTEVRDRLVLAGGQLSKALSLLEGA